MGNITDQIRPQLPVPKTLVEYTPEEMKNVPRLFEWFANFYILLYSIFLYT